jgi:hypothetical protein
MTDEAKPTNEFIYMMVLTILVFIAVVLCVNAKGAPIPNCRWTSCVVHQGAISVCGASEKGTRAEMLVSENKSIGGGHLFLRECLDGPKDRFEIDWSGTHGVFKNRDTNRR